MTGYGRENIWVGTGLGFTEVGHVREAVSCLVGACVLVVGLGACEQSGQEGSAQTTSPGQFAPADVPAENPRFTSVAEIGGVLQQAGICTAFEVREDGPVFYAKETGDCELPDVDPSDATQHLSLEISTHADAANQETYISTARGFGVPVLVGDLWTMGGLGVTVDTLRRAQSVVGGDIP